MLWPAYGPERLPGTPVVPLAPRIVLPSIRPLPIGKLCTAIQVMYVALVLLFLALRIERPQILQMAAFVTAGFTIASWLAYGALWFKALAVRYRRVV